MPKMRKFKGVRVVNLHWATLNIKQARKQVPFVRSFVPLPQLPFESNQRKVKFVCVFEKIKQLCPPLTHTHTDTHTQTHTWEVVKVDNSWKLESKFLQTFPFAAIARVIKRRKVVFDDICITISASINWLRDRRSDVHWIRHFQSFIRHWQRFRMKDKQIGRKSMQMESMIVDVDIYLFVCVCVCLVVLCRKIPNITRRNV